MLCRTPTQATKILPKRQIPRHEAKCKGWGALPGCIVVAWTLVSARVFHLVWKTFKLEVFHPNPQPALPTAVGWALTLQSPSGITAKSSPPSSFPTIFVLLLRVTLLFSSCSICSRWLSISKCILDQGKNSFQIITPSSQSPPESPQHQCLSWVMHGMEPHTVCSRHRNHGNTPDESCYLGWSQERVAEGSSSCPPLLPKARSLHNMKDFRCQTSPP